MQLQTYDEACATFKRQVTLAEGEYSLWPMKLCQGNRSVSVYLDEFATLAKIGNIDDKVIITALIEGFSTSYASLLSIKAAHAYASGLSLPLAYVYECLHIYTEDHK